jgi:hypothetical protein
MPIGQSALVAITAHQVAFQVFYGLKRAKGIPQQVAATEASAAAIRTAAAAAGCAGALTVDPAGAALGLAYLAGLEAVQSPSKSQET